ncbi:gephyrin-like molybdotransferase Glp [Candidatus Methylopumilus planktonicus]|uniref:molybdopterin molybdotransferase MoeA n=1 Tax=Candidatus Methylopumilus planktonicus TaxID=1581557 RepID=UPI0011227A39|nr:gephyrin-like molybdotransferase Glp [Candidatus Methylopumilus planktonicus]QDD11315.1 molybdopterin molybdotransferase MoeA [Candidatus Methylopumilus planktonicus]QDD23785.1 molybdopterin molybdotransferase MoeA [Candidatus Methylopumilus planktonicus]
MKKDIHLSDLISDSSMVDDYDPNAMSVEKAKAWIANFLNPIDQKETIHIKDALNRIVAEPIIATMNVPNHDNSAMDGYAINIDLLNDHGPFKLKVTGKLFAGNVLDGNIEGAVRIMTGAIIPSGLNAVIPQEHVELYEGVITFKTKPLTNQNIRRTGEDIKRGQTVFQNGRFLEPCDLGLLASLGIDSIKVYRKIKVAFFSTGDEIISLGKSLLPGQVYDSNRYSLIGLLKRLDVDMLDFGVIPDDKKAIEETLLKASNIADIVVTTGGVSVGEADFMKDILKKIGEILFWKISMKPGKPLAYGKIGQCHYFGLPGNPVSTMVTFYQFVREAILSLSGQTPIPKIPLIKAKLLGPIKKIPGRTEFQRGVFEQDDQGTFKVNPLKDQGSGILRSMSEANCFILLHEDLAHLEKDMWVDIQLFDSLF